MPDTCQICGGDTANPCPTCHRDRGRNIDWWVLRAKRGKRAAFWNRGKVERYVVCADCSEAIHKTIRNLEAAVDVR